MNNLVGAACSGAVTGGGGAAAVCVTGAGVGAGADTTGGAALLFDAVCTVCADELNMPDS